MKAVLAAGAAVCAGVAVAAGLFFAAGRSAPPAAAAAAPVPPAVTPPSADPTPPQLVLHEWGTFTSFSGSDGVPVRFHPNNSDLPGFVYHHPGDGFSKSDRLLASG